MKISQREARRLRKENSALLKQVRDQRTEYVKEWPGGIHILTVTVGEAPFATLKTARRLAHAVVATLASDGQSVYFYALPLPEQSA